MASNLCFYLGKVDRNDKLTYINLSKLDKYKNNYNINSNSLNNYVKNHTTTLVQKIMQKSKNSKFVFEDINYLEIIRETLVYLIKDCYEKKYIIEKILKIESADIVKLIINESLIKKNTEVNPQRIIIEICKNKGIEYTINKSLVNQLKDKVLFEQNYPYQLYYKLFYQFKELGLTKLKSYFYHKKNIPKNIKYLFMPFSYSEKNILRKLNKYIINGSKEASMYIDAPYFDRSYNFLHNQWKERKEIINSFGEFYNLKLFFKSVKKTILFNKKITNEFIKVFLTNFKLDDLSLSDLILDNLIDIKNTHMKRSIKYSVVFEELISKYNINNLIISKARWPFMKTILLNAKKFNLNTIFIPHGLYYDDPLWSKTFVKNILTDGEHFKNILLKRGENKKNIVDFGNLNLSLNQSKKIKKKKNDKKVVTYFSSTLYEKYNYQVYKKTFEFIRNILGKYENAKLNIKLHPREKLKEVKKFFNQDELQRVSFFTKEKTNKELIVNSDAIFCVASSVIIEILACGIKPYLLNFWDSISYYDYEKKDYVISIDNHKFEQFIEKEDIFNKQKVDNSNIDYFTINNISNMKRILEKIIK